MFRQTIKDAGTSPYLAELLRLCLRMGCSLGARLYATRAPVLNPVNRSNGIKRLAQILRAGQFAKVRNGRGATWNIGCHDTWLVPRDRMAGMYSGCRLPVVGRQSRTRAAVRRDSSQPGRRLDRATSRSVDVMLMPPRVSTRDDQPRVPPRTAVTRCAHFAHRNRRPRLCHITVPRLCLRAAAPRTSRKAPAWGPHRTPPNVGRAQHKCSCR